MSTAPEFTEVRYPDITVPLVGLDDNAGSIMGRVTDALRAHGVPSSEVDAFRMEAYAGGYQQLLQTVMRWVEVC